MVLTLDTPLESLPGIGAARGKKLAKLGLETAGDLAAYFPRSYEDRTESYTIREAPVDVPACIAAMVAETPRLSHIRKGLDVVKVKVVDETAAMTVTFFNQSYVKDALRVGESYVFYGKTEGSLRARQMTNPAFEKIGKQRFTGRIMPVYPLTAGISNNLLAGLAERCVGECAGQMAEVLPERVRLEHALAQSEFSYRNIHFPESWEALELARRRLIFEELFQLSCGMALLRSRRTGEAGPVFAESGLEDFWALLPFTPTSAPVT